MTPPSITSPRNLVLDLAQRPTILGLAFLLAFLYLQSFATLRLGGEMAAVWLAPRSVFMPAGILNSGEVARVHRDVIARIRRVLERSGLKSASVGSLVPFGPRTGLPLQRLRDPDLARAHQSSGW